MHLRTTSGSGRVHQIVDGLFQTPMITIPTIRNEMDVSYPTAKGDVEYLVNAGILAPLDVQSRPKVFYAPGIFSIAYKDLDEE